MNDLAPLIERYHRVLSRIQKAEQQSRFCQKVTCIAVSKGHPIKSIQSLYELGHRDFGENYVQELLEKAPCLPNDIRWHFIGHLQTNKVRSVLPLLFSIHTVDSVSLIKALEKNIPPSKKPFPLWIQVNLHKKEKQSGLAPEQLLSFLDHLETSFFSLKGLMGILDPTLPAVLQFQKFRELEQSIQPKSKGALSMGMSSDYETAILEGATHIRLGTALFGSRPIKDQ